MHFVLTRDNRVVLGPIAWSKYQFQTYLNRSGYTVDLPIENSAVITISAGMKIYPARTVSPSIFNPKIEQYSGPTWSFTASEAIGLYTAVPLDIDTVKGNIKNVFAAYRYKMENAGTTVNIQNTNVTVDTSRETRNMFVQQYLLMDAAATSLWKFPEGWLNLTKTDLGQIVAAGAAYIQNQFNDEASAVSLIDACTTLSELDLINLPN